MHNDSENNQGYERSDMNVKIVVATFIVTVGAMVVSMILMRYMDLDWRAGGLSNSPMAVERPVPTEASRRSPKPELPDGPKLQVLPEKDLAAFNAEQATLRDSYGWVDQDAGIAHIPVSVAKEHVINHGIPDWSHLAPTEEGAQ